MNCEQLLEDRLQDSLKSSTNGKDATKVLLDAKNASASHSAMCVFGIDRESLFELGLDRTAQDRCFRILYVYSDGFFSFIKGVNEEARRRLWLVFLRLTETNFSSICAVDSLMRQQYESTLHSLLEEHEEIMRKSHEEFQKVEEQITSNMTRDAAARHEAIIQKKTSQSRAMQLEEYSAQLSEELKSERNKTVEQESNIQSLNARLSEAEAKITALSAKNEALSLVATDHQSVTDTITHSQDALRIAEFDRKKLKDESERLKVLYQAVIAKEVSLQGALDRMTAQADTMTSELQQQVKANKSLDSACKHLRKSFAGVCKRLRDAHALLHDSDQAMLAVLPIVAPAVSDASDIHRDSLYCEIHDYTIESELNGRWNDLESQAVEWAVNIHDFACGVDRAVAVQQMVEQTALIDSKEKEIENLRESFASLSRREYASEFMGERVWGVAFTQSTEAKVFSEELSLLRVQVGDLATANNELISGETRLKALISVTARDMEDAREAHEAGKKDTARLRQEALELRSEATSLRTLVGPLQEEVSNLSELLESQYCLTAALKQDLTVSREKERLATQTVDRKSGDIDALNLSNSVLFGVFSAVLQEIDGLAIALKDSIARIDRGEVCSVGAFQRFGVPHLVGHHAVMVESQPSLLPKEKGCIHSVIQTVVSLPKEMATLVALASDRGEFERKSQDLQMQVNKLNAWASRERLRLQNVIQEQGHTGIMVLEQRDSLIAQLRRECKDAQGLVYELRQSVNSLQDDFSSLSKKVSQLKDQSALLETHGSTVGVTPVELDAIFGFSSQKNEAEVSVVEDDGVDWGFDEVAATKSEVTAEKATAKVCNTNTSIDASTATTSVITPETGNEIRQAATTIIPTIPTSNKSSSKSLLTQLRRSNTTLSSV